MSLDIWLDADPLNSIYTGNLWCIRSTQYSCLYVIPDGTVGCAAVFVVYGIDPH